MLIQGEMPKRKFQSENQENTSKYFLFDWFDMFEALKKHNSLFNRFC